MLNLHSGEVDTCGLLCNVMKKRSLNQLALVLLHHLPPFLQLLEPLCCCHCCWMTIIADITEESGQYLVQLTRFGGGASVPPSIPPRSILADGSEVDGRNYWCGHVMISTQGTSSPQLHGCNLLVKHLMYKYGVSIPVISLYSSFAI